MQKGKEINWKNHEDHVASVYQWLGYEVNKNINIQGKQTDLVCEKWIPGIGKTVLYVDCKYTRRSEHNSVTNSEVAAFIHDFKCRKDKNGWTAGILLSNRPFTQFANATAKPHHDVFLKTIPDLYEELLNIRPYLHSHIHNCEETSVFDDYITLNSRSGDRELYPTGQAHDLHTYVDRWLCGGGIPQLFLLGDFGSGKTTFLQHIFYVKAKEYLQNQNGRIPIFVALRDYYDAPDIGSLIQNFFQNEVGFRIPFRVFENCLEAGRFLMLLDGFDEMGDVSDQTVRRENYLKISQLTKGNSKIIISCRPAYFVTKRELADLFCSLNSRIGFASHSVKGEEKVTKSYEELAYFLQEQTEKIGLRKLFEVSEEALESTHLEYLQVFDKDQISRYLSKHEKEICKKSNGSLNSNSLLTRIEEIYDLEDLAKRPILLKLICQTLPNFIKDKHGKYRIQLGKNELILDEVTPSVLYHVYTERELQRDYSKGKVRWLVEKKTKSRFIEYLGYQMFIQNTLVLNNDQLQKAIKTALNPEDESVEYLETDIRTTSFLSREKNDSYRFAHKSFMEYYAAQYMLKSVDMLRVSKAVETLQTILSSREIPEDILYFMGDSIHTFYPFVIQALHNLNTSFVIPNLVDKTCKQNVLNLLNFSRQCPTVVEGVDIKRIVYYRNSLASLRIANSTFEEFKLIKTNIDRFNINKTMIKNVFNVVACKFKLDLVASEIENLNVIGSQLSVNIKQDMIRSASVSHSQLEKSVISNSTVCLSSWQRTVLRNVSFNNILFYSKHDEHLKNCEMNNVVFDNCVFFGLDFNGDILYKAKFNNCIFIRCKKKDDKGLELLLGSHGFFIGHRKSRKFEEKNHPSLWNPERIRKLIKEFQNIKAVDEEDLTEKRSNFLSELNRNDLLNIAFRSTGSGPKSWSIIDIRKRIDSVSPDALH